MISLTRSEMLLSAKPSACALAVIRMIWLVPLWVVNPINRVYVCNIPVEPGTWLQRVCVRSQAALLHRIWLPKSFSVSVPRPSRRHGPPAVGRSHTAHGGWAGTAKFEGCHLIENSWFSCCLRFSCITIGHRNPPGHSLHTVITPF